MTLLRNASIPKGQCRTTFIESIDSGKELHCDANHTLSNALKQWQPYNNDWKKEDNLKDDREEKTPPRKEVRSKTSMLARAPKTLKKSMYQLNIDDDDGAKHVHRPTFCRKMLSFDENEHGQDKSNGTDSDVEMNVDDEDDILSGLSFFDAVP